jgi:uncharacterized lipoprotein YmbA
MKPWNLLNQARLLLLIGIMAGGCSVLPPQEDRARFFALTPAAGSGRVNSAPAQSGNRALTVGLGPITIPRYLDRPEVVTRLSDTEFSVSDTDRWAEPLGVNVSSVIKQDLAAAEYPAFQIVSFPWSSKTHIDYRVSVDFHRLERTADGRAEVQATWIVRTPDGKTLQTGNTSATAAAGNDQAPASAALSRGVAQVSGDIAQALAKQSALKSAQ